MLSHTRSDSPRRPASRASVQREQGGKSRRHSAAGFFALESLEKRSMLAAAPAPSLAIGDASIVEGNDGIQYAAVSVRLSAAASKSVQVNYNTADGTANAGSDFHSSSGILSFAAGEMSRTILLAVSGDRVGEMSESFLVNLSGAKGTKIADSQGIVTIVEDEPIVRISGTGGCKGSETTVFTFPVNISCAYDQPVTVDYHTQDGTAIAGVDYSATLGTLTFSPGETSKIVSVEVLGNSLEGPGSKTFYVALTRASSNASISAFYPTGAGMIIQSSQPDGCWWDSSAYGGTGAWVAYGSGDSGDGSGEYLPWG